MQGACPAPQGGGWRGRPPFCIAGRRRATQCRLYPKVPWIPPVLGSVAVESGFWAPRSRRTRGRGGRGRRHHRSHDGVPAGHGGRARGRARARPLGEIDTGAHHRAPDDGHGHARSASSSTSSAASHAQAVWDAGLAAIAPDRLHRPRRRHRLRLRVGARLPARADRRRTQAEEADTFRDEAALAPRARVRRRVRRRRPVRRRSGRRVRRSGAIPSAPISRRRSLARSSPPAGRIYERSAADEFSGEPLGGHGERHHHDLPTT